MDQKEEVNELLYLFAVRMAEDPAMYTRLEVRKEASELVERRKKAYGDDA